MIFIFWGFCTGSDQQISTLVFGSLYGATIVSAVDPLDERWGVGPMEKNLFFDHPLLPHFQRLLRRRDLIAGKGKCRAGATLSLAERSLIGFSSIKNLPSYQ